MYQVSNTSRRIVGRFSSNEELVEALTEVCAREGVRGGEVRVRGRIKGAEVVRLNPRKRQYEVVASVDGEVDLVSATGVVSVLGDQAVLRIDAVMSAQGPFGPQTLAGEVRGARAVDVEFVMDVFEDLTLKRKLDRDTGGLVLDTIEVVETAKAAPAPAPAPKTAAPTQAELPVAAAPEPAPAPEPTPEPKAEPKMSWGEAVAATEKPAPKPGKVGIKGGVSKPTADEIYADFDLEGDEEDLPEMKPGDLIDHPKLGRCRVMRVEDEEYAHIRLPRGKISKLMLDLFDVSYGGKENGKNVFVLRMAT